MIDATSIAATATSLKAASEAANALLSLITDSKARAKVIELQREIMAAQGSALASNAAQFALLERVRDLEKQIDQFENWEAEAEKYESRTVARPMISYGKAIAFVHKDAVDNGEPFECLCANCFQQRRKSLLQPREVLRGCHKYLYCPNCKTDFGRPIDNRPPSRGGR